MKTEGNEKIIRWYILGAIGGILMAAGDWLLGCIPIQGTDTGMFNRAYYLSGSYGLWRPVLIVGLGAIGAFLYCFMVKALNADIDAKYRKTKLVHSLGGGFTVAVALAIHTWSATLAWFTTYLGPRMGTEAAITAVTAYRDDMLIAILPHVSSDGMGDRDPFRDAARGQNPLSPVDAGVSSGRMEPSAGDDSGHCPGHGLSRGYVDVRYESEQHEQRHCNLVRSGCNL